MISAHSISGNPFFSLIIPVYNAEGFLDRCIFSILKQSFHDYELILVNDCSMDSSVDICNRFADEYSNIRVIDLARNSGVVHAREVGLLESKGKYIIYVDADDAYLSDDRLQLIFDEIIHNGSDIVATGYKVGAVPGKSRKILNSIKPGFYGKDEYKELREKIFSFNEKGTDRLLFPSVWSKAVKRELYMVSVGRVSYDMKMGEDAAISYVALALAESLSVLDDTSYFYFQHPNQVTRGYYRGYYPACVDNYLHIESLLKECNPTGNYQLAVMTNIAHVSVYSVLNEGRNPDRKQSKQIVENVVSNPIVYEAVSEYNKGLNAFYRHICNLIERKAFRRIGVIGRIYCLFLQ